MRPAGSTDDELIDGPRAGSLHTWFQQAADRLAGADPGLTQLRTATQAVLGVLVTIVLIYVFVQVTGALQLPAGAAPAAVVTATNHALLIVSMLVGGILAMMAGFTVNDPSRVQQLLSTLMLPIPMLASIAVGLAVGPYRIASLVYLVVVMTVSVYVRRFGPRGFAAGLVAFQGGFLGFFLHTELHFRDLGWLTADLGIAIVASLIVRFGLLRTDSEQTLDRMRRSWQARAFRLLDFTADAVCAPDPRHRTHVGVDPLRRDTRDERVRQQVVRLNESTLIVEAQLVLTSPTSARVEAQQLFGAELSLTNCARFGAALAHVFTATDDDARADVVDALHAARDEDWDRCRDAATRLRDRRVTLPRMQTLLRRLALSVEQYASARTNLYAAIAERRHGHTIATFEPAIALNNGFLPGSAPVSEQASTTPGLGRFERTTLPPYLRATIQIAIASTLAVTLGNLVDGARLYWAVLATFLAFMATTNTGEQVRKALFRVAGTAIGIVVGDVLVHVTGGNVWAALPVAMIMLFLGIYLIRTNYTFMVIGVTMMLSLIYYQLGELSWHLLALRLAETAVGVGAVVVTVLVVLPLRPQRVLTAGVLLWSRALSDLLDATLAQLLSGERRNLRPLIRALDASWASLEATAKPLRHATFGRNATQLGEIRVVSSAARYYARSFADTVAMLEENALPDAPLPELAPAAADLRASIAAIRTRIETREQGTYMRCAAMIERAVRDLPRDSPLALALRDVVLLDGALARLATALDMQVRDHDTSDLLDTAPAPQRSVR